MPHQRRRTTLIVSAAAVATAVLGTGVAAGAAPGTETDTADLIEVESRPGPRARITGLAPGDHVSWAFTVRSIADEAVDLEVAVATDGWTVGDPSNPEDQLLVEIDSCGSAWLQGADPLTGAPVFSCPTGASSIVPQTPSDQLAREFTLANGAVAPGTVMSYRAIATIPPQAGNDLEALVFGGLALEVRATISDPSVGPQPLPRDPAPAPVPGETARGPLAATGTRALDLVLAGLGAVAIGIGLLGAAGRPSRDRRPVVAGSST